MLVTVLFASSLTSGVHPSLVYYLSKFNPEVDYFIKLKSFKLNYFVHTTENFSTEQRYSFGKIYFLLVTLLCFLVDTQRIYKLSHCCSLGFNNLASLVRLLCSIQHTTAVDIQNEIKWQNCSGILSNLRIIAVGSNQLQFSAGLSGLHLNTSERQYVGLNYTTKYSLRVSLQRLTCPN